MNFSGNRSASGLFSFRHLNGSEAKVTALFALLIAAVLSPNLFWLLGGAPKEQFAQALLLPALASVGLLLSLSSRLWLGSALLAPWAVLAPFEAFYISDFGKPSDPHLFGIIADSNIAEASGFLAGVAAYLAVLAVFALVLALSCIVLSYRRRLFWQSRSRYWVLLASVLALGLPEVAKLHGPVRALAVPSAQAVANVPGAALADSHVPEWFDYLHDVYPAGVPGRAWTYAAQRRALDEAQQLVADFRFNALQAPVSGRQVHVLVIGETGRPDHWQLNGYARQTMPLLSKTERVTSFKNAFSPWAWTRMAVPLILTRKSPLDNNQFFPERSVISAFREAGFRTYWFSTQSPLGPHDSSIALHAAEAHERKFLNHLDYKQSGVFDGVLLAPLEDVLKRQEEKVLIVLHTLGGHFNYADRHPDEFDRFRPSLKGVKGASLHKPELKEEFSNSFDNSLLYLDFFLSEVVARVSATKAVASLFYIADHGENLYDDNCDKAGHGRGNEYDFRVPALFWHSAEYASLFPDKVAAAASRVDSPIATSNVFHSLLDAASIHYPAEDLTRSIFNSGWQARLRITQNKIDFDQAVRDKICKKLLPTPLSVF